MAKCRICGAELSIGANFCSSCGAKVGSQSQYESRKASFADKANEKFDEFRNTTDTTSEFSDDDINSNKIKAAMSYLGLLVFVPLFFAKDSRFARFHVNQGLVLMISESVFSLVIGFFGAMPGVGLIFGIVGFLGELLSVLLSVVGILNTLDGKAKDLPIVGKIRIIR